MKEFDPYQDEDVVLMTSKLNPDNKNKVGKADSVRPVSPPRAPDLSSLLPNVPSVSAISFDRDRQDVQDVSRETGSVSHSTAPPVKSRKDKILQMRARKKEQRELANESARLKQRTLTEILSACSKDKSINQATENAKQQATLNAEYLDSLLESSDSSDSEQAAPESASRHAVKLLLAHTRAAPPGRANPGLLSFNTAFPLPPVPPRSQSKFPLPPPPPPPPGAFNRLPAVPPPPGMSTLR